MTFVPNQETVTGAPTVCAVHPNIETTLRCNKCGRYMCTRCAVRTPVGYRCKQCVNQQQDVFYSANQRDYLVAAAISFVLSLPVSFILPKMLYLAIIFSIPAGALIAEVVHRAIGRRRGRYTWAVVVGGIVAGAIVTMIPLFQLLIAASEEGYVGGGMLVSLLIPLVYLVLCAGGAAARLRYGK